MVKSEMDNGLACDGFGRFRSCVRMGQIDDANITDEELLKKVRAPEEISPADPDQVKNPV